MDDLATPINRHASRDLITWQLESVYISACCTSRDIPSYCHSACGPHVSLPPNDKFVFPAPALGWKYRQIHTPWNLLRIVELFWDIHMIARIVELFRPSDDDDLFIYLCFKNCVTFLDIFLCKEISRIQSNCHQNSARSVHRLISLRITTNDVSMSDCTNVRGRLNLSRHLVLLNRWQCNRTAFPVIP